MIEQIRDQGGEVETFGENWNEANKKAIELVNESPHTRFNVNPFDDPLKWQLKVF